MWSTVNPQSTSYNVLPLPNSSSCTVSFKSNLSSLLNDPTYSDVTLVAKSTSGETNSYFVHRNILASSSDVFKQMFSGGFKESAQKEIIIEEIEPFGLFSLLQYIYHGEIKLTVENAWDIMLVAEKFLFMDLAKQCARFLESQLSVGNVFTFFRYTQAADVLNFHNAVVKFMINHFEEISTKPEFRDLPVNVVLQMVKSDSLKVSDEMKVLQAVIGWGTVKGNNTPSEKKNKKKGVPFLLDKSREGQLAEMLGHVRFPTMTPHQLHEVEKYETIMQFSVMTRLLLEAWKAKASQPADPNNPRYKPRTTTRGWPSTSASINSWYPPEVERLTYYPVLPYGAHE